MQLVDSEMLVQHPCPSCELSEAYPDVSMSQWCNGRKEVLEITSPDKDRLSEALRFAKERIGGLGEFARHGDSVIAMKNCSCFTYRSICALADDNDCWVLFPITYSDGWERYRIIAPSKDALNRFVSQIKEDGTVKILSVKPATDLKALQSLGTVPVHFFQGLTDRQLHALVTAYEKGLLDVPAKKKMDRIAKEEGFSRSTYGEHLRKAVHRVIQNSYPMLKMYDSIGDKRDVKAADE